MTDFTTLPERAGQVNAPQESIRTYMLVLSVYDRLGVVDRIVGLLRRRRASMKTLIIGHGDKEGSVPITVTVDDSEVGIEQLIEQLRKIIDVQQVTNVSAEQSITRELALIKVNSTAATFTTILEIAHLFGAHTVDVGHETVTLEVTGSEEKITRLSSQLEVYGIREVVRTGSIAIAREVHP